MSEKIPKRTIADFEQDGVLKPVVEVAFKIANHLGAEGISCDVRQFNTSLLIIVDENEPITYSRYNGVIEDYTQQGVVISFNEEEQIIRVAPFKN